MWRICERIDCIDLESSAPRARLASQADLLTFGVGDLSAWIVAAAAPQPVFSEQSLGWRAFIDPPAQWICRVRRTGRKLPSAQGRAQAYAVTAS